MATNLLIADAGMLVSGTTAVTLSHTENATYPASNLFGGNKSDAFKLDADMSGDFRFNIQHSGSTANFLYIGGAKTLQEAAVTTITVKAYSSNTYASAATIATVSSFDSATLRGPHGDDYITTFATSSSYPWWYVVYAAGSASKIPHSKMFLGNYFDIGRDPNGEVTCRRTRPASGQRKALYTYSFTWEGVAYSKAVTLYSRYYRNRRHNPVILFTTDYHDLLNDNRVIFGRIVEMSAPPRATDYCDITMTFEEMA